MNYSQIKKIFHRVKQTSTPYATNVSQLKAQIISNLSNIF